MSKSLQFKKPKNYRKSSYKIVKMLISFASIAVLTIIGVFIGVNGFQAVIEWLVSKWACMMAVIILFAATIIWWIADFARNIKRSSEDE